MWYCQISAEREKCDCARSQGEETHSDVSRKARPGAIVPSNDVGWLGLIFEASTFHPGPGTAGIVNSPRAVEFGGTVVLLVSVNGSPICKSLSERLETTYGAYAVFLERSKSLRGDPCSCSPGEAGRLRNASEATGIAHLEDSLWR